MDCVGQIFKWVEWVTRVKIFFTWVIIFAWVKYIFVWVFEWVQNFCVDFFFVFLRGSAFCTRWDYFSILQLIVWAFFSWVSSQQILTKPCLTPLVFLGGLIEICKIDEIQWHYMNVWLNSTCELQNDLILKEDPSTAKSPSHPTLPKLLLKISFIYGNFFKEKSFRKNAVSCLK